MEQNKEVRSVRERVKIRLLEKRERKEIRTLKRRKERRQVNRVKHNKRGSTRGRKA